MPGYTQVNAIRLRRMASPTAKILVGCACFGSHTHLPNNFLDSCRLQHASWPLSLRALLSRPWAPFLASRT